MSVLPVGLITEVRPLDYVQKASEIEYSAQAAPPRAGTVNHTEAAEELSFGIAVRGRSQAAERESVSLNRPRDGRTVSRQMFRIGRLRGVYAAFDQVFWWGEVVPQDTALLERVHRHDAYQDPADTRGEDPFKTYVYLLEAERQATAAGDTAAARQVELALDKVWNENAVAVAAGFNTLAPMLRFAKDVGEWDRLRDVYLESVVAGDVAKTFKALLERFRPERLHEAIGALRNAIAADLASPIVCADKQRWQQQYLDLIDNRRLSSLVASSSEFCTELLARDPEADLVMNFVGSSLDLASSPTDRKFAALCTVLLPEPEVNEIVRMRLRNYLKKHLPLWLWASAEARDQLLFPPMQRLRG
jgi:hypothetical protein